jgi:hypothetical protein
MEKTKRPPVITAGPDIHEFKMGSAGFEPAASSARGWHHTKLDNDPSFEINFLKVQA